jgi:hypothetical protein
MFHLAPRRDGVSRSLWTGFLGVTDNDDGESGEVCGDGEWMRRRLGGVAMDNGASFSRQTAEDNRFSYSEWSILPSDALSRD